jgi:hypothetical protein
MEYSVIDAKNVRQFEIKLDKYYYIHLYFFLGTTYFGVVSGVFLVLDAGFVLKFYILVFPVFIELDFKLSYILCINY